MGVLSAMAGQCSGLRLLFLIPASFFPRPVFYPPVAKKKKKAGLLREEGQLDGGKQSLPSRLCFGHRLPALRNVPRGHLF